MKIEILRDCAIKGVHVPAGDIVDASDRDAIDLINMGKATPSEAKQPSNDRSVGLTTETAAPIKKRGRKK